MKLYATVTSERASKGQGGNKYIRIELAAGSAEDSKMKYVLEFTPDWILLRDNYGNELYHDKREMIETKGEKQKGECPKCGSSNNEILDNASFHCIDCDFTES